MPSLFDNPLTRVQCEYTTREILALAEEMDKAIAQGEAAVVHVLAQRISVQARTIVRATAAEEPHA